jgi:hypothetical protein
MAQEEESSSRVTLKERGEEWWLTLGLSSSKPAFQGHFRRFWLSCQEYLRGCAAKLLLSGAGVHRSGSGQSQSKSGRACHSLHTSKPLHTHAFLFFMGEAAECYAHLALEAQPPGSLVDPPS